MSTSAVRMSADTKPLPVRYLLACSDGRTIEVPSELWEAMEYMRDTKRTGAVEIHFRSGGVDGIEAKARFK